MVTEPEHFAGYFSLVAYCLDGKRIKALLFAMFSPVKLSSHSVGSNIGPLLANG